MKQKINTRYQYKTINIFNIQNFDLYTYIHTYTDTTLKFVKFKVTKFQIIYLTKT